MDITPIIPKSWQLITGYGEGGFKLNQQFVKGSLLVFPDTYQSWDVDAATVLTPDHFAAVIAHASPVELLLIGTGKNMKPLDAAIKQLLKAHNIASDVMDTGAACRTYNVLLSEERRVATAVIAI